jgi:hypothetical protein
VIQPTLGAMRNRLFLLGVALVAFGGSASAQRAPLVVPEAVTHVSKGHYWRPFAAGFVASILLHETGHIAASYAVGGHPSFGFDKARPTVYSGISARLSPQRQFLFSSAGLTVQNLLDELILDAPHGDGKASAFERGILAGGMGTTFFYITIGRTGSVSDVDFMSRTSTLSKAQISLIYGGVAAIHALRVSHNGRYANFFARPSARGGMNVGVDVK